MKNIICHVLVALYLCTSPAFAKSESNEFIKGVDYGKSFLKAKSPKGKKYRAGLHMMHLTFGPWFWEYMRWEYVPACSRAWLESRGHCNSHTKDTTLLEAGLMSNGYEFTRWVCMEYGICGDPCGDPEFSIALGGFRRYLQRQEMFYGTNKDGEPNFWNPWLAEQAEDNRWEAEAFIGACGSINCQKLRKAITVAHKEKGILNHKHKWWQLMIWFREQNNETVAWIFNPKKQLWKMGSRIGRVMAGLNMRKEFFPQPESSNGDEPEANYCWGEKLMDFPFRTEMVEDENGVLVPKQVPDLPEPLRKWTKKTFPKRTEWRQNCVLYGSNAWHKTKGGPKPNDRYKQTACRDGKCWKKGQKKYPTHEDWEAAYEAWVDEEQAARRLPSDEEYAVWGSYMATEGCAWQYQPEE